MNTHKIAEIFEKTAKAATNAQDALTSYNATSAPLPTIRGGQALPERVAEAYIEALDEIADIAGTDGTWSKFTVDEVLWEHIEKVLQVSPAERPSAIRSQAKVIVERFKAKPLQWTLDLLITGMATSCDGLEFGRLTFICDEVKVADEYRRVLASLLTTRQTFARLDTTGIDGQSALEHADSVVDEHLAILNSISSFGDPSLTRVSRWSVALESDRSAQYRPPSWKIG